MGRTLSNGVYLPDEGERNCYAGLKVNWEILNQKVADISALQLAIAGALHREIVESLPTTDIDPNTIYMILSGTSATENMYNEYMYVNNAWELIGTSATDLTNYYTKAEVDGKLLLKANASDLTSHTSDTTIHVTANDKTKWTNSANTHVLRLALSALTPSTSNNSFSNLDDSTALKVGDKVMDTAGVLFEVTAIDTANSTFTIGTALIDLLSSEEVGDVALSNNYNDLDNLPTIPTVNDAVLTIQKNGSTVKTFTANASSNVTCNITVPTKTSELTNDSGFLTSHQSLSSCVKNSVVNNQTIKSTGITRGTAPSSTQTFGIAFSDNNNKSIGNVYGVFATDMSVYVGLYAYKGSTTANSDNVSVRVGYDASGNAYTYAPTPATTDNSTQIATTAFVKAQDSNVVHKSGNETKSGELTLSDTLKSSDIVPLTNLNFNLGSPDYKYNNVYAYMYNSIGRYLGNEANSNQRTNITLYANRDTQNQSCAYITRFRQNRAQGALQTGDLQMIGFDVLENEVRTNNVFDIQCTNWLNNVPQKVYLVSSVPSYSYGRSSNKALINDLNPGALSLPDLNNGIDISSYITHLDKVVNQYTPPSNGWLSIRVKKTSLVHASLMMYQTGGLLSSCETTEFGISGTNLPVIANQNVEIYIVADSLASAKFYPCQGNV